MVRDRVGGGGRVKFGFVVEWDCLPVSSVAVAVPGVRLGARAGGGRLNAFSVMGMGQTPLPWISAEAAGVGGRLGRGMLCVRLYQCMQIVTCPRIRLGHKRFCRGSMLKKVGEVKTQYLCGRRGEGDDGEGTEQSHARRDRNELEGYSFPSLLIDMNLRIDRR